MPDLQYVDSPDVLNSEILWRVIAPNYIHPDPGSGTSTIDISEGAFRTKEMSVFRASRITSDEVLRRFPTGSIVATFPASLARDPPRQAQGASSYLIRMIPPMYLCAQRIIPKNASQEARRTSSGRELLFFSYGFPTIGGFPILDSVYRHDSLTV
jgi:hypothetical protein